jgi:uncharacterized peroxidase-related enzyme
MSRITPLDPTQATGPTKELLDTVQATLGATPNMTRVMARSAVLDGWLALGGALAQGSIRPATAERIALGVAEANGCSYCLSAHTYLGEHAAKLSDDELAGAREFDSEQAKAAAILAFAQSVLAGRGKVSDQDLEAARAAGLSDAELADTVGHVALNVLTNYFNVAFEVDVDFPVVEPRTLAI